MIFGQAPVRQILRDGLDLGRATVFVGGNGSDRFRGGGLWILGESESVLYLSLLSILKHLMDDGDSRVILSTHSPLLASLPGAQLAFVHGSSAAFFEIYLGPSFADHQKRLPESQVQDGTIRGTVARGAGETKHVVKHPD
ncbi:hypothetical protein AAGW05_08840 [Arthrobacter sp. LAPM80]|uniref:hypothetical protein n=1 Tax=Arthrobacter sp. LAPM80 TaxID=3141788 RepID=UPI00398BA6BC